jgi:hypothetical protein
MPLFAAFRIGLARFLVALLGLFLTGIAPAAGMRRETAPTSSGRETRLVFTATIARDQPQIFSLEPSGRAPAQLTFGEPASAPLPSPDGRHVLFERTGAIWVMRPDGKAQRLLVAHGIQPAWARDSRRIAYVSVNTQNDRLGIRVVGLGGGGRMLVPGADVSQPAWSPDGRSVAFGKGDSLLVLRAGIQHRIVARPGVYIDRVVWSADGGWLAFEYEDPARGLGLEVVRATGRNGRDLPGIRFGTAAWSPMRALLAYVGYDDNPQAPSFRLLNPATGHTVKLAPAPWFINTLAWAPEGRALAFSGGAYLSEDLTTTSALGIVTLAGHVHFLDHGLLYPLPESVAWTASPRGRLRYRPPVPAGPLLAKDELRFREPVDELAADGDRVAYRFCGTIGVWRPGDAKVVSVQADRPLCVENNIGFYNLALAGDRSAWGIVQGGIQRSSSLVVETVGDPSSRAVVAAHSQIAGDPRGDERAGYLVGQGPLLAFSTWAFCDDVVPLTCPGLGFGQGTTIASQTLWRVREASWPETCPGLTSNDQVGGSRCQQLRAEPGPLRLLDVDEGRIVASGDNATVVLDADGRPLLSLPVSTRAAELAGSDLTVVVPGELRDYDVATGALLHSWPLPYVSFSGFCGVPDCGYTQFRLEDAARGLVVYLTGGPRPVGTTAAEMHLLRLADGRDVALGAGTAARFGAGGLFYAYEATGLWPGRIRFIPFSELPLR